MSHPSWVRGLKLNVDATNLALHFVAPFMGAWIETSVSGGTSDDGPVAPFMGAWIETVKHYHRKTLTKCRTLHGCVD